MVLLTVADVTLRAFFSYPIRGMLELIELGLACTIFIALPAVFLRGGHLVVDVIRGSRALDVLAGVVTLVVLAFMLWHMLPAARNMIEFGDVTSDLSLPRLWYWIPVLFGVGASVIAVVVVIFQELRRR